MGLRRCMAKKDLVTQLYDNSLSLNQLTLEDLMVVREKKEWLKGTTKPKLLDCIEKHYKDHDDEL
eukprot:m.109797 g.109797  ORF g.109797 m.109797 type:complete len:65 (+) comp22696_c0_seq6:989-1183(+)